MREAIRRAISGNQWQSVAIRAVQTPHEYRRGPTVASSRKRLLAGRKDAPRWVCGEAQHVVRMPSKEALLPLASRPHPCQHHDRRGRVDCVAVGGEGDIVSAVVSSVPMDPGQMRLFIKHRRDGRRRGRRRRHRRRRRSGQNRRCSGHRLCRHRQWRRGRRVVVLGTVRGTSRHTKELSHCEPLRHCTQPCAAVRGSLLREGEDLIGAHDGATCVQADLEMASTRRALLLCVGVVFGELALA